MKTALIIVGIIAVVAFVIKSCVPAGNSKNKNRPNLPVPTLKVPNDKLVLIENMKPEDVKKAIEQFCNKYNQEEFTALPLLTILSPTKFIVTFPFDIDFITYCFFVNYMHYPEDVSHKPSVVAWTSTKPGDEWMTNEIVNKTVMVYIPPDDQDYDNVYLTTSDNIGYKMGFASGEEKQRLDRPRKTFIAPPMPEDLEQGEQIQFK